MAAEIKLCEGCGEDTTRGGVPHKADCPEGPQEDEGIKVGPRLAMWQVMATGPATRKATKSTVLYLSKYFDTEDEAKLHADTLWLDQLRMNPLVAIWVVRRWVF